MVLKGASLLLLVPNAALGHTDEPPEQRLADLGPAPGFTLSSTDGKRLALADLRGKVVAINFIYTRCPDTCPLLTVKLLGIQRRIASPNLQFVSITVDPENDTPSVLAAYAEALGCDAERWAFLTGAADEIDDVTTRYGIYAKRETGRYLIDHTFLTSIVDRRGQLRVQYLGTRFDPDEFVGDLTALLEESNVD